MADFESRTTAIMFSDTRGFSGLRDFQLKAYFTNVLPTLGAILEETDAKFVNSWGDGIVAVFDQALRAAECALRMQDTMRRTDWASIGLPDELDMRIGIHAAHVLVGHDPIRKAEGLVGSQVNLAARIEPIVEPGRVFATASFMQLVDLHKDGRIAFDPLGDRELAKG